MTNEDFEVTAGTFQGDQRSDAQQQAAAAEAAAMPFPSRRRRAAAADASPVADKDKDRTLPSDNEPRKVGRRSSLDIASASAASSHLLDPPRPSSAAEPDPSNTEGGASKHGQQQGSVPYSTGHDYIVQLKTFDGDGTQNDDADPSKFSPRRSKPVRNVTRRATDRDRLATPLTTSEDVGRVRYTPAIDTGGSRRNDLQPKRSGSIVSFASSVGSMGSYIERKVSKILDGPAGSGTIDTSMIKAGEVTEDEAGGLLDNSLSLEDISSNDTMNQSSSDTMGLNSIPEVVFKSVGYGDRVRKSLRRSEASNLTDDEEDLTLQDRIDRLERMAAARGAADDEMTVPLSVGDLRGNGSFPSMGEDEGGHRRKRMSMSVTSTATATFPQVSKCRRILMLLMVSALLISTAFRLGMYEGGSPIVTSDGNGKAQRPSSSSDKINLVVPKVSLALENALLKQLKDQSDDNRDAVKDSRGKDPGLFFSGVLDDRADVSTITSTTKRNNEATVEVLVQCTHEDGCLEAMALASAVKLDETSTSKIVSIDIDAKDFDKLRTIDHLNQIDVDFELQGIEDEVVRDHIEMHANTKKTGGVGKDGSLRGRRDAQSTPPGFKMIQAIRDDGTPFPPGPYRRKLCIADTGTCKGHPDLSQGYPSHFDGTDLSLFDGAERLEWDEDRNGHGCHLHGTVSAVYNDIGIHGIGGSNVFVTRALGDHKRGSNSQMMAAVNQCVHSGASVILLSLGCYDCEGVMSEDFFQEIHKKGILIVASAGNDGHIKDSHMMLPAGFPQSTVSVGAVDLSKRRHEKSAINNQVEFCAMGTNVVSTGFNLVGDHYEWDYVEKTGTSMAAPQVAAVACLLWSYFPRCTGHQIREVLARTAIPHAGHTGCNNECGHGIVQMEAAYELLKHSRAGDDYDCDVGGPILSSTGNVCDCVDSNFSPSKCLFSTTDSGYSPADNSNRSSELDMPRCKDNGAAKFMLAPSARKLRKHIYSPRDRRRIRRKRNNKQKRRSCKFIGKTRKRATNWCSRSSGAVRSCKRVCSEMAGMSYSDCSPS